MIDVVDCQKLMKLFIVSSIEIFKFEKKTEFEFNHSLTAFMKMKSRNQLCMVADPEKL